MSHYSVLVIGENVEKQLEPFWELDLSREEMIDDFRAVFNKDFKKEDLEKEFKKFKEKYKKEIKEGKEDYWVKYRTCKAEEWFKSWSGSYLNKEETYYGHYNNPNAKWDWFEIGGRWAGSLKLKKGKMGFLKEQTSIFPKFDDEKKEIHKKLLEQRKVDSALKKDIDFSPNKKEYKKALRFWELKVEGQKPKTKEDREALKWDWYKPIYYKKKFKTKENYAKLQSEFSTLAVLKDGEWFEAGEMGWFGCSSATPRQEGKFKESFFNNFIKDLHPDIKLTIVDCHI